MTSQNNLSDLKLVQLKFSDFFNFPQDILTESDTDIDFGNPHSFCSRFEVVLNLFDNFDNISNSTNPNLSPADKYSIDHLSTAHGYSGSDKFLSNSADTRFFENIENHSFDSNVRDPEIRLSNNINPLMKDNPSTPIYNHIDTDHSTASGPSSVKNFSAANDGSDSGSDYQSNVLDNDIDNWEGLAGNLIFNSDSETEANIGNASVNSTNISNNGSFSDTFLDSSIFNDSPPSYTKVPNLEDDSPPGLCGLVNLGNTCFMNSAFQCMSNTWQLTEYFLSNTFKHEINKTNTLGTHGSLAFAYDSLLKELWESGSRSFAPRDIKRVIGRFAPQFAGYQQQDAPEFLSFFLDGLHEDLNRIYDKPYIEIPDSDGRSDSVVADEQWEIYKKRNDSIIVDLFQGQLKSAVTCPVCDYKSVTFDPSMYLTLLLPTNRFCNFKINVSVPKTSTFQQMKVIISHLIKISPELLMICEVYMNRIYKILDDEEQISEFDSDEFFCVYDLAPFHPEGFPSDKATVNFLFSEYNSNSGNLPINLVKGHITPKLLGLPIVKTLYQDQSCEALEDKKGITIKLGVIFMEAFKSISQFLNPDAAKVFLKLIFYVSQLLQINNQNVESIEASDIDHEFNDFFRSVTNLITVRSNKLKPQNSIVTHFLGVDHGRKLGDVGHSYSSPAVMNFYQNRSHKSKTQVSSQKTAFKNFEKLINLLNTNLIYADQDNLPLQENNDSSNTHSSRNSIDESVEPSLEDSFPEKSIFSKNLSVVNQLVALNDGDVLLFEWKEEEFSLLMKEFKVLLDSVHQNTLSETTLIDFFEWDYYPHFEASMEPSSGISGNFQISDLPTMPHILVTDSIQWELILKNRTCISNIIPQQKEVKSVSLSECFNEFVREEKLDEQDSWYCSKCKEFRQATKKLDLWRLPEILVIHLKRFDHSREWSKKIDTLVEFPLEGLDLSGLFPDQQLSVVNSDEFGSGLKTNIYDLYATSNHFGGLGGGHYTAFARNPVNGNWYNYNDSSVSLVSDPQSEVVSSSAYMLFYRLRPDTLKENEFDSLNENPKSWAIPSNFGRLEAPFSWPSEMMSQNSTPATKKISNLIQEFRKYPNVECDSSIPLEAPINHLNHSSSSEITSGESINTYENNSQSSEKILCKVEGSSIGSATPSNPFFGVSNIGLNPIKDELTHSYDLISNLNTPNEYNSQPDNSPLSMEVVDFSIDANNEFKNITDSFLDDSLKSSVLQDPKFNSELCIDSTPPCMDFDKILPQGDNINETCSYQSVFDNSNPLFSPSRGKSLPRTRTSLESGGLSISDPKRQSAAVLEAAAMILTSNKTDLKDLGNGNSP
ncbi:putative ubiquitin carboxyl-terminal hydrolase 12 [Smittium mucronatum]|uniref:ubiquitinyl hydrolase 1 n=1 Tax=Smittium mucronatum TaxID=133383 RepID=A0A1R0H4B3_9FUNG|nr:putative ubiquitin carboxyl-terminal hydrolase 12 [Smittium mucronatum]